jgi:hypothetical protein
MDKTYRPSDLEGAEARSPADPLAMPEELNPVPANEHSLVTPSQAAGVPTEDHASEDFARPERTNQEYSPLLSAEEGADLQGQWESIQVGFVDEPRMAVQRADALVALAMKRVTDTFADERGKLEQQWDRGDECSTEDLRLALRRYRSFFQRLLSV